MQVQSKLCSIWILRKTQTPPTHIITTTRTILCPYHAWVDNDCLEMQKKLIQSFLRTSFVWQNNVKIGKRARPRLRLRKIFASADNADTSAVMHDCRRECHTYGLIITRATMTKTLKSIYLEQSLLIKPYLKLPLHLPHSDLNVALE